WENSGSRPRSRMARMASARRRARSEDGCSDVRRTDRVSSERKSHLERDENPHGHAHAHARRKAPLLGGLYGFFIKTEPGIEGSGNLDIANATVGVDHHVQQHVALNLR